MKRFLCIALSFALIFTCLTVTFSVPTQVQASTADELQEKIDALDDEIDANQEKLDALKKDQKKQKEYLEALEKQMKTVEEKATNIQVQLQTIDTQIGELDDEINQLTREITQTQKDIETTQQSIVDSSDLLAQKLRDAYMNGDESTLEIFMGSEDLAGFMTKLELMKRTAEKDKAMIDSFRDKVVALEKSKAELEVSKAEYDAKRNEQQIKRDDLAVKQSEYNETLDELEGQYAEIENYLESLDKSSSVYEEYIAELESEKAKADAEIDEIYKQYYATTLPAANANPTPDSSGGSSSQGQGGSYVSNESWAWPLGNEYCYISSKYGYRDASISGWSFHGGIDIAGGSGRLHGKPIYATRSGKVIKAVTSNSGYGIYVIIDHGDGYSSLYGHMSARYVSTGDTVSKGDMIGRVGNTGNSRGAHLHFEIRYYGEKLDPLKFVSKP